MIYFDSAATTLQKPPEVAAAVFRAIGAVTTPGRGDHGPARMAAELMFSCRGEAAALFGVPEPEKVVFTMNASHGLNIAIRSLLQPGDTVVISGYEHNAVSRTIHDIGGLTVRIVNAPLFQPEKMVEGFSKAIDKDVKAVVCIHVSNVFGYELPIAGIADICRQRGVPLIVDASQSAGILPVDISRWGAAYVAMPGHKGLYGPQGTGLLLCGEAASRPLITGGTGSLSREQDMPDFLPDQLEAGTHNVHGIVGLLEGIRFVNKLGTQNIARYESDLIQHLEQGIRRKGGYQTFPNGGSVLSIVPENSSPEEVAQVLAQRDVAVRAGLHCAPLAHLSARTDRTGTIRFSASAFNFTDEVDQVLSVLP